jgi:hypothetical protein
VDKQAIIGDKQAFMGITLLLPEAITYKLCREKIETTNCWAILSYQISLKKRKNCRHRSRTAIRKTHGQANAKPSEASG